VGEYGDLWLCGKTCLVFIGRVAISLAAHLPSRGIYVGWRAGISLLSAAIRKSFSVALEKRVTPATSPAAWRPRPGFTAQRARQAWDEICHTAGVRAVGVSKSILWQRLFGPCREVCTAVAVAWR